MRHQQPIDWDTDLIEFWHDEHAAFEHEKERIRVLLRDLEEPARVARGLIARRQETEQALRSLEAQKAALHEELHSLEAQKAELEYKLSELAVQKSEQEAESDRLTQNVATFRAQAILARKDLDLAIVDRGRVLREAREEVREWHAAEIAEARATTTRLRSERNQARKGLATWRSRADRRWWIILIAVVIALVLGFFLVNSIHELEALKWEPRSSPYMEGSR